MSEEMEMPEPRPSRAGNSNIKVMLAVVAVAIIGIFALKSGALGDLDIEMPSFGSMGVSDRSLR